MNLSRLFRLFPKGTLGEIREWMVAGTGLAALLVAAVSFWTTARVSDLEDYLRSEISRRNNDLNILSAKTEQAERIAFARAERLDSLEAATDEIIAASLSAQGRLLGTEADLTRVRNEVINAQQQLAAAREAGNSVTSDLARQTKMLDLFQRQQAYQTASMMVTLGTGFRRDETPSGASALEVIYRVEPDVGQTSLTPYLQIVKDGITRVCPNLGAWRPTLPERSVRPPQPTIRYYEGTSRARIAELTREAQDRWSEQYRDFSQREDAYNKARLEKTQDLWKITSDCICSSLTTSDISRDEICPGSRS